MKFKKKNLPRRKFVKIFFRLIQILLSEKIAYTKKSTFSYRLLMLIFWKPISNLVIWQIFRIFGHSLTESHGLEESEWGLFRHFFQYSPISLIVVPFSQFSSKSNDSYSHFRAFFMLYTNQITQLEKTFFWSIQAKSELGLLGGFGPKSKIIYFFPSDTEIFSLLHFHVEQ